MRESKQFDRDRFAEWLGIELLEQSFDQAICRVSIGENSRNALGGIHGGLIFSLADVAFHAPAMPAKEPTLGCRLRSGT